MENKLHIQLGDILKIINETNEVQHNEMFYVEYVSNLEVELRNIKTKNKLSLSFKNPGVLGDGTIQEIQIIYRHKYSGYAKQHNLETGAWINVHMGGDIPIVFTAEITDLIEDMIEVKTTTKETLYINFDYKGIPKELPITLIEIRNKPDIDVEGKKTNIDEIQKEDIDVIDVDSNKIEEEPTLNEFIEEEEEEEEEKEEEDEEEEEPTRNEFIDNEIKQGDNIVIYNSEKIRVKEYETLKKGQELFTLEEQLISLQDSIMSRIPTRERTDAKKREIQKVLDRYVDIRDESSIIDENGIAKRIPKGNRRTALQNYFQNLDRTLYWIVPVIKNKRKLFTDSENVSSTIDSTHILYGTTIDNDLYETNEYVGSEMVTRYESYQNRLDDYSKPYVEPDINERIIKEISVGGDILAASNMSVRFKKGNELTTRKYVLDRYVTGLTKLVTVHKTKTQTVSERREMNKADKVHLTSFMTMPEPIIRFSRINLPSTNILERSTLNGMFMNYWQLFKSLNNCKVKKVNVRNEERGNKNGLSIYADEITKYIYDMTETQKEQSGIDETEMYANYVNNLIPSTKSIFYMMQNYMKVDMTFKDVVKYLEPFLIYTKDITYQQYVAINKYINYKRQQYKKDTAARKEQLKFLRAKNEPKKVEKAHSLANQLSLDFGEVEVDVVDITIDMKYGIADYKSISNGEYYRKMMVKDKLRIYNLVLTLQNYHLMNKTDITPFLNSEHNQMNDKLLKSKGNDTCKNIIISKRYESIGAMEADNHKELKFDKEYDKTNYDLLIEYEKDIQKLSEEEIRQHIKNDLETKKGLNLLEAEELTTTLLNGYQYVKPSHYAILRNSTSGYEYFVRTENKTWEIDNELEKKEYQLTDADSLCQIQKDCITKGTQNKCTTTKNNNIELKSQLLNDMMSEFDNEYIRNRNEMIENLKDELIYNWKSYGALIEIRKNQKFRYNNKKINISQSDNVLYESVISPYNELLTYILLETDMIKQSQYIIKYVTRFVRTYDENKEDNYDDTEETETTESNESKYWYYCPVTNTRLLPIYRHTLASSFLENRESYMNHINELKKTRGVISDDGGWWIDKETSWRIIRVDLDTDEVYGQNRKDVVIEEGIHNESRVSAEKQSDERKIISNVTGALSVAMGINLEKHKEQLIRIVEQLLKCTLKSREAYSKTNKISYEDYFMTRIMYYILGVYLIIIQTSIPSIKTKKTHSGCVRSFDGYPLEDEKADNYKGLQYLVCVAHGIRNGTNPWKVLKRLKKEKIESTLKSVINEVILGKNEEISHLITEKIQYLSTNMESTDVDDTYNMNNWTNFSPPLKFFSIKNVEHVNEIFNNEFAKNIKNGNSDQRKQIGVIKSKIVQYSTHIQRLINDVVAEEKVYLYNSKREPYLENTCCHDTNNMSYNYYCRKNKTIHTDHIKLKELSGMLKYIDILSKASHCLSTVDTKIKYPVAPKSHSEKTIYLAFIKFCKFNNENIAIPSYLEPVCHRKPNYDIYSKNDNIVQKIQQLKEQDFDFNVESFNNLLKRVHLHNRVNVKINNERQNVLHNFIQIVEDMSEDDIFINSTFKELLTNLSKDCIDGNLNVKYTKKSDLNEIDSYRRINEFLFNETKKNKTEIERLIGRNHVGKALSKQKKIFANLMKWNESQHKKENNINEIMNYYKSFIFHIIIIFPRLIINKLDVSKHGTMTKSKLSENHVVTYGQNVENYYIKLINFYDNTYITETLLNISKESPQLIKLIEHLYCFNSFYREGIEYSSRFDEKVCRSILEYILYKVFKYLIDINPIEKKKIQNVLIKSKIKKSRFDYFEACIDIFNVNKGYINNTTEDIQEYIFNFKEKEKNMITDRQESLTEDEKGVDRLLRSNKLGVWAKGNEKGYREYDADNFDNEAEFRREMNAIEHMIRTKRGDYVEDFEETEEEYTSRRNDELDRLALNEVYLDDDGEYSPGEYDGD